MIDREKLRQETNAFLANQKEVDAWFEVLFEYSGADADLERALRNMPIDAINALAKSVKRQLEH